MTPNHDTYKAMFCELIEYVDDTQTTEQRLNTLRVVVARMLNKLIHDEARDG